MKRRGSFTAAAAKWRSGTANRSRNGKSRCLVVPAFSRLFTLFRIWVGDRGVARRARPGSAGTSHHSLWQLLTVKAYEQIWHIQGLLQSRAVSMKALILGWEIRYLLPQAFSVCGLSLNPEFGSA
jgi:hypothetical protein